jgi:hypothetical protein
LINSISDIIFKSQKHNNDDPDNDDTNKSDLNKLIDEHIGKRKANNLNGIKVSVKLVDDILSQLKNNKAIGWAGVSNEMLKYAKCVELSKLLSKVYEIIINTGFIPTFFNISILKPLIKDEMKSSKDKSNQRPLSISDVFSSVLEKLINHFVKQQHVDHVKEFGFKSKSSCLNATFVINELLKIMRKRNQNLYIISVCTTIMRISI